MPDPIQTSTPGQALSGPPAPPDTSNLPVDTRTPPQSPIAPQPPQPQVDAHHSALGKAVRMIFGAPVDDNGNPIKQRPGQLFRTMLASALIGGAIGSENPSGGFLGGLARGGAGVIERNYQHQQQALQNQRQQKQLDLEQSRFQEEQKIHQAQMETWNIENIERAREADYRDRTALDAENAQDENMQKWVVENGGQLEAIPDNGKPGNGPGMMKRAVDDPQSLNPQPGFGRVIIKKFDFSGLKHNDKGGGWTEENGDPVNWSKHTTWSVYQAPLGKQQVTMSGADWKKYWGVDGLEPDKNYSVGSVSQLAAQAAKNRTNQRKGDNDDLKRQHDALAATISSAKTNITEWTRQKNELLHSGYDANDTEVKDLDTKIADEQQREKDATEQMHPLLRPKTPQQKPSTQTPNAKPTAKPTAQAFSPSKWKAANPGGDVTAAIAEAKKQGYQVIQ